MCQCVLCDCCWWNVCGVCCAGYHYALCIASCWLCKPLEMLNFDSECCHCCTWTGYGGNCFCYGVLWCAPEPVKNYSRCMNGEMVGGNVIIVNNTASPMMGGGQNPY